MLSVMALGDGAFGSFLDHEGRPVMNEINALVKEAHECSLAPSHDVRTQREGVGYNQKESLYQNLTMLVS